jgi:hypothetical protein
MGLVVKDDGWRIPDEGVRDLARRHPRRAAKTDGIAVGLNVADLFIAQRAGDGFRVPVPDRAPSPPIPGVWIPTAPTPPIGTLPRAAAPVRSRLGGPVPACRAPGALEQAVRRLQRGQ